MPAPDQLAPFLSSTNLHNSAGHHWNSTILQMWGPRNFAWPIRRVTFATNQIWCDQSKPVSQVEFGWNQGSLTTGLTIENALDSKGLLDWSISMNVKFEWPMRIATFVRLFCRLPLHWLHGEVATSIISSTFVPYIVPCWNWLTTYSDQMEA